MTNPIPLVEPDLRGHEADYLAECVRTGWISSGGRFVVEAERRIAELCQASHAVMTSSGTTALQLLLSAVGVSTGSAVIVPDWTFAATVNAVIHAGGTPLFVDVAADTWSLDPRLVEQALGEAAAAGQPVAAVIAVHPLGIPADMDRLGEICRQYNVPLLEDAAGAIGSRHRGRMAGNLADAGIFSFNGNKLVTGGGGGSIVTNRADWANRIRHVSTQARIGEKYEHDAVGYNFRLTNLNAALIVAQLERLDEMMAIRRAIIAEFDAAIAGRNDLQSAPVPAWCDFWNGWMPVVLTESEEAADELTQHFAAAGIGARPFWRRLSVQRPYAGFPRLGGQVADRLSGAAVSLPCNSTMTPDQIRHVAETLRRWRSGGKAVPVRA